MERAGAPAVGPAAKEAQPGPSLAGDAASNTSGEDMSESESKGKVGASKIEELEDLFPSGSKDHGGDGGARGKDDVPDDMADQQDEDLSAFPNEE